MFDFNGDGRTDTGEQFTGYQIFTDMTKGMKPTAHGRKLDVWEILIIVAVIWQVLNTICGG